MGISGASGDLGAANVHWVDPEPEPLDTAQTVGGTGRNAPTPRTPISQVPVGNLSAALLKADLDLSQASAGNFEATYDAVLVAFESGEDLAVAEARAQQLIEGGSLTQEELEGLAKAHAQAISNAAVHKSLGQYKQLNSYAQEQNLAQEASEGSEAFVQTAFQVLDDGALPQHEQRDLAKTAAQVAQVGGPGKTGAALPWEARTEAQQAQQQGQQLLAGIQKALAEGKAHEIPTQVFRMAAGRVGQGLLSDELAFELADTLALALKQRAEVHWNGRAVDIAGAREKGQLEGLSPQQLQTLQKETARAISSGVLEMLNLDALAVTNVEIMQRLKKL
jgi:hypothetical protein